jgi:probable HAF family extracellular repeat protein
MQRAFLPAMAVLAACAGDAVAPQDWFPLEHPLTSRAVDINDRGQIVGSSSLLVPYGDTVRLETHTFLWTSGTMHDLGTLGGDFSEAIAVTEEGIVLGQSATPDSLLHPVLWIDGEIVDLLPGHPFSAVPTDLNERRQVVGSFGPPFHETGFVWDDGVVTNLATLGGDRSSAAGINELGQVVGYSENGSGHRIPFIWSDGVLQTLPLGGASSGEALDINDSGRIIGQSGTRAVIWDDMRIRVLGGGAHSTAVDLNESGEVIGHLNTNDGIHSFVFGSDELRLLGSLGGRSTEAVAINENGLIIGMARTDDHEEIPVLWQDGVIRPLIDLLAIRMTVQAVNRHGQVVGFGITPRGAHHALLWSEGFVVDLGTLGDGMVPQ